MPTFILLWLGQTVSLIGSGLTSFALGVSIYQTNGSIAQFSLIYLCAELPAIIIAPLSGTIVDRFNRRWIMIVSDSGAGLSTLVLALLFWSDSWEVFHVYLAITFGSLCKGFQWPAYYATPTLLVDPKNFGRANGLIQLGKASAQLFSPALAGILVTKTTVEGVMAIDFVSFFFALLTILIVRFPDRKKNQEKFSKTKKQSWWEDLTYGWNYLIVRQGLFLLLMFFMIVNFAVGLTQVLITPMVLSFSNVQVLGNILSIGGCGWLLGAVLMSVWRGPKKKIRGVIGGEILLGLNMLIVGLKPSVTLIGITLSLGLFNIPIIVTCANAIRQIKVATEAQGRVFAIWGAVAYVSFPFAYLVASPLTDRVFNPLLTPNGLLADSLGRVMGVGETRGIGLLFVVMGLAIIIIAIAAYQNPHLRLVEDRLPDMDNFKPQDTEIEP